MNALNSIDIIGKTSDIQDLNGLVYNRLIIIKVEPWMSCLNILDYVIRAWYYDCTLPGISEKEVRGKVNNMLIKLYGKNTHIQPFNEDTYLLLDLK